MGLLTEIKNIRMHVWKTIFFLQKAHWDWRQAIFVILRHCYLHIDMNCMCFVVYISNEIIELNCAMRSEKCHWKSIACCKKKQLKNHKNWKPMREEETILNAHIIHARKTMSNPKTFLTYMKFNLMPITVQCVSNTFQIIITKLLFPHLCTIMPLYPPERFISILKQCANIEGKMP